MYYIIVGEEFMFPSALTIAGVDSCGGAGIAADLKTFASLKVHGACIVTSLTAQNTTSVINISPVDSIFVKKQFQAVLNDLNVKAVKTGMLFNKEIIDVVAEFVKEFKLKLVVDPVLQASTGAKLISNGAVEAYLHSLFPLADVLTPNIHEVRLFSGVKINKLSDMEKAASEMLRYGGKSLVLKGGHLKGKNVVDLFFYKGKFEWYIKPRFEGSLHGSGCFFSAAIAAYLAHGLSIPQAVDEAESITQNIFKFGLKIGKGSRIINPMIPVYNEGETLKVVEEVNSALQSFLEDEKICAYIADVGTQIAMALPFPSSINHIAAVEGRIRKENGKAKVDGEVKFGASSHMARLILACNEINPEIRAAINLKYDKKLLQTLRKSGFSISKFDRKLEPANVKKTEGGTMRWGVSRIYEKTGRITDAIYDLGEKGREPKEAMIRIVGKNAVEIVDKLKSTLSSLE